MNLVVSILVQYLISHSAPLKDEARQYLKDQLDGWKEDLVLSMFDIMWDSATKAVGKKYLGEDTLFSIETADELAKQFLQAEIKYVNLLTQAV